MKWKLLLGIGGALIVVFVLLRLAIRGMSGRPENSGVTDGRLRPCPASPNCVCSQDEDAQHAIPPLTFTDSPAAAFERLQSIVAAQPGARLVTPGDDYLQFEFTTRLMGFVDDVEFLLDRDEGVVHCRSASRLGRSDLGVNRARIETIRRAFDERDRS